MTTFNRTTILKGPCKIVWDTLNFFSRGDVTVTFSRSLFEKTNSAFGKHADGVENKTIGVSFAPIMYDAGSIAKLWPYASIAPGMSVLGATDLPMVITPRNGAPLTIKNAFVDVPPTLTFAGNVPLFGDVTFMGVIQNNNDPSLAASFFEYGAAATGAALDGFDGAKDVNATYSLTRGGQTYYSEAGFVLDPGLTLVDDTVDGIGLVGKTLSRHEPTVTFLPAGMTETAVAALQDFGVGIGKSDTPAPLTIQGQNQGEILFTLNNTIFGPENDRRYGAETRRVGDIEFRSVRTHNAGALTAAYTFGAVPAPE